MIYKLVEWFNCEELLEIMMITHTSSTSKLRGHRGLSVYGSIINVWKHNFAKPPILAELQIFSHYLEHKKFKTEAILGVQHPLLEWKSLRKKSAETQTSSSSSSLIYLFDYLIHIWPPSPKNFCHHFPGRFFRFFSCAFDSCTNFWPNKYTCYWLDQNHSKQSSSWFCQPC